MSDTRDTRTTASAPTELEVAALVEQLYADGIVACRGAFTADWVRRLDADIDAAFQEAIARPDGAVQRGPNRWYVEVHPEQISGFLDLVDHPWVTAVCRGVLGDDYEIVEIGFDIPFPGAELQPWHRDFPMPEVTRMHRKLNSLAFNVTTIDTTDEMGPFEIAPGTQWDHSDEFAEGMFPPESYYPRYESLARRTYPKVGDISARSALTIHRGTANRSQTKRPVLVLGVDAPGAGNAERHEPAVTRGYWERLPQSVRDHLHCAVVDELTPITQKHQIDRLNEDH